MATERRPDPDQLLADVAREEARRSRGRLKVFFGMAAGVGKTYAMLEEARARAAEGLDVVIGYAEPHIRPETESLLLGMEILPFRTVQYRNATLKELDLDAVLARKPLLVCIDELAHTNAPGLRHLKRWQDVEELLDAGISVYSTLNVQHIESVNDIVERVTGVRVRETLPDSVLERADEVELVDIAPEELLERFREGKVYRPEQAERAARHFFTKGNLLALRELALRTTAQRVDAQMQEARRQVGDRRAWDASERVLVCVSPSPMSLRLVRSAKRLATSLRAEWIAVYVETPQAVRLSAEDRRRLDANLQLVEQLGGKSVTLSGSKVADEVIDYAQRHNVTKIIVGKPLRTRLWETLFGSAVDELIRRSGEIDIYVIRGDRADATPRPDSSPPRPRDTTGFLAAVGLTAAATAVGWPMYHQFGVENENILMLYLVAILWIATRYSRTAAIFASVLVVAAFDFVFVPPYYTFAISDRQYVVTFLVMLMTALVISTLTHRLRFQGDLARQRERRTAALFALSRDLAVARSADDISVATIRHVGEVLRRRTVLMLADDNKQLVLKGGGESLDEKERGVAQWAWEHDQTAGRGTGTLPAADGTYLPLRSSRGVIGVLGLVGPGGDGLPEQRQLAEAFASQAALAAERTLLAEDAKAAWERVEAEFLRNTLLSAVSHDLRTPLAGIIGAATAVASAGEALQPTDRNDLLDTVVDEAERMERLITNLLDMTRLEAGNVLARREWQPLQEVVGSTLHHLERRLRLREVKVSLPSELPLVNIDAIAIEQVLTNLIDNAVEYSPPETPVEVHAHAAEDHVVVEVADRGPGLPPGVEERVFEKFFRARPAGQSRRGIGLGLAICRAIVNAHGGTIRAAQRPGGGAVFRFTLPRQGSPPNVDTSD